LKKKIKNKKKRKNAKNFAKKTRNHDPELRSRDNRGSCGGGEITFLVSQGREFNFLKREGGCGKLKNLAEIGIGTCSQAQPGPRGHFPRGQI